MTPNSFSLFHVTWVSVWDKCVEDNKIENVQEARVRVVRVDWGKETGRFSTLKFCWETAQNQRVQAVGLDFFQSGSKYLWEVIKIFISYGGYLNLLPLSLDPKNTEKTWPSAHLKPKDVLQSFTAKRWQLSKPCAHLFLFDAWVLAKCVWPTP